MNYFIPTTLSDALDLMDSQDPDVIAGGTDFLPGRGPGPLVRGLLDISRISELRGIERIEGGYRIGAATRWSDLANAELPAGLAGLQSAAREVGSLQIQNAGTIGGNICNASPAADGVPPLLTLDASVEVRSQKCVRLVPLSDFILGVRSVAVAKGELVTALCISAPPPHARGAFSKLGSRRYMVISISMVAAVIGLDAQGRIDCARIAVGACSPVARRLEALEADLLGHRPRDVELTPGHLRALTPIDDVRGSGAYRLRATAEQCRRIIHEAAFQGRRQARWTDARAQ